MPDKPSNQAPDHSELLFLLLQQAFEESRYNRRFHHVVFTIFMTIYAGFLGLQLAYSTVFKSLDSLSLVLVFFVVIAVLPSYVCTVFVQYHKTIVDLNAVISILSGKLMDDRSLSPNDLGINEHIWGRFLFGKYKKAVLENRGYMSVGRGQWFFLVTFILLVLSNLIFLLSILLQG